MGQVLDPITLSVTRRPGAWTAGEWVPNVAGSTTFTILASRPQPVGPETLEMLPEGARSSARFMICVPDGQPELYMVEHADHAADYVAYAGRSHLVTLAEDWTGMPLGYRAYVLLEVTHG